MRPMTATRTPIWTSGSASRQIAWGTKLEGRHGSCIPMAGIPPIIECLRQAHPELEFTTPMHVRREGMGTGELNVCLAEYEAMGVQHLMIDSEDREMNDRDQVPEGVGMIAGG